MSNCNCGASAGQHSPGCRSLFLIEKLQNAVDLKTKRALENLCAEAIVLIKKFEDAIGPFDNGTLQDLRRMIPVGLYDPGGDVTRNPLSQVMFRAGLLACREYMARFVEPESPTIANSIRHNWWPQLGDDPGPPRLFDFNELCDEIEGPKSKDISPTIEALPRAYQFLVPPAAET